MDAFLYVVIGFALGTAVGQYQKDGTCDWKKAALAAGVAIIIAVAIVLISSWLR